MDRFAVARGICEGRRARQLREGRGPAGSFDVRGIASCRGPGEPPQRAAAEPHDPQALADRERPGLPRAGRTVAADLEEAEAGVTSSALAPRGTLKLTCSITFGERHIAPVIAAFAAKHPQLRFDVELSDRMVDLVEEGFDLAIRIGAPSGQALIARRIGGTQLICCAVAGVHRASRCAEGSAGPDEAPLLSYSYLSIRDRVDVPRHGGRRAHGADRRSRVRRTTVVSSPALAVAGMAISLEPDIIVGDELRSGRLVELLPAYRPTALPIYAVYPSRRHLSAKVRAFVDFIAERFAREASWTIAGIASVRASKRARTGVRRSGR